MKKKISLNTIERVKRFNAIISQFTSDVFVQSGRYVIDAKSIMGLFSLNLIEPVEVYIESRDTGELESFNRILEEFK